MVSLWKLIVQVHNLAGPIVMLAFPLYSSVNAIESPFKEDDIQWLTYWVLYSLLQLIEIGFDRVLAWIPLWYTFKLAAILWLVLPQFHGAAFVYDNYVRKYIGAATGRTGPNNEKLTPKERQLILQMSPTARSSVSAFISEYGPDAFDKVITSITEANRKFEMSTSSARYNGYSTPAAPSIRYSEPPLAARPTRYTGSPTVNYTGSPPRSLGTAQVGSKADSFREYCRQPARVLKSSLQTLERRRNEIRGKLRTRFVP